MKIVTVDRKNGAINGVIVNHLLIGQKTLVHPHVDGIEYDISLQDDIPECTLPEGKSCSDYNYTITLGKAEAMLKCCKTERGGLYVRVAIQSSNTHDFIDLFREVYSRLGVSHEVIPTPKRRLVEPSFIKGIKNDLRNLNQICRNRWQILIEKLKGIEFPHY